MADRCRHVRRPDEPAGPGGALCVARPEEVGGERHGHDVRRVLARDGRLVPLRVQDGLRRQLVGRRRQRTASRPSSAQGRGWTHFIDNFWGKPGPITSPRGEQGQAVSAANTVIPFHFPTSSLAYFQFVFAAITPLLFMGSVLGRIKFSAWCLLVPLWSTFVYSVDAFLLWGGGYFAQEGALDYSGGYVIHMSAGVSGLRGRLGPRTTAPTRQTARHPQQPGHGRGRGRNPVARLERLQRW